MSTVNILNMSIFKCMCVCKTYLRHKATLWLYRNLSETVIEGLCTRNRSQRTSNYFYCIAWDDCQIFSDFSQVDMWYSLPSSHFPICLTCPRFSSVSSPSTYLRGLLILLSTDTAIINHGKEYSWSRLRSEVGRLPASLPVLHSWSTESNRDFTLIQEHHAQKNKPGQLQQTSSFCSRWSSPTRPINQP